MKRKRAVLLVDVANYAGVSQATVSVVLNNQFDKNIRVSEQTRKRVLNAAQTLNYTPNLAARSLAGRRNNIIAIFTYEPIFPYEQRNFLFPFLVGIEQETERAGYDLLLTTSTGGEDGKRSIYRNGINRIQEDFPVVFLGHREFPSVTSSYVAADYITATARITEYILSKGHTHINYVGMKGQNEPSNERKLGYTQAMQKTGNESNCYFVTLDSPEEIDATVLMSALKYGATAFITEDYIICNRIVRAAKDTGLQIPESFSIAVLGGPSEPGLPKYDWTSFLIPDLEMGRTAVSILLKILASSEKGNLHIVLDCSIHYGSTVAEPPSSLK
jgi:DNA-binding LacI/PurR family transcriptional regulator